MSEETIGFLPVEQIIPNPEQPRKSFDQDELVTLSNSILEHGVINPVAVTGPFTHEDGRTFYTLIDGERRLRAAKLAGLVEIPAMVRMPKTKESNITLAMIGNLQRSDLNPIEEATAYKKLNNLGWSYKRISEETGVGYQVICQRVSLLNFDPTIQRLFAEKRLPLGPNIVVALNMLPEEIRTKTALKFAANHTSSARIESACQRIAMRAPTVRSSGSARNYQKNETPSLKISGLADSPSLKALSAAGTLPEWAVLQTAAQETCEDCTIREAASEALCRDCPVIDLLQKIYRMTSKGA